MRLEKHLIVQILNQSKKKIILMASRLKDIKEGSAGIKDLAYWINERHSIFVNRFVRELPKPWTNDPIFQQYKFTNAFRQLDKGTIVLREMLMRRQTDDPGLILFNIIWYRLFNWYEHAEHLGFIEKYKTLDSYIQTRFRTHKKIFTGAHMTTGVAYEDKHISYLRACKIAWDRKDSLCSSIIASQTMEIVFNDLLDLYMVGRFIAYELVCDLRFTRLLENATDKLTWANMGPGAQRGLRRLGMPHKNQAEGLASMRELFIQLPNYFNREVAEHRMGLYIKDPPFELREVEHSLCEFDKYQRVKLGEGRPRGRYNGVS